MVRSFSLTLLFSLLVAASAQAQPWAELEAGPAFQGRNDVRIPGKTGSNISFTDDLDAKPGLYGRARVGWDFGRHRLFGTAAPVKLRSEGQLDAPLRFYGYAFAAGSDVKTEYKFNTYRLTYRYLLVQTAHFEFGLGASALLRHAHIRVDDGTTSRIKKDLGVVPLLRLEFRVPIITNLALRVDADGLASPQGRAFDVLSALEFPGIPHVTPYLGYRFIEGGSDIDEVYNFAFLHFAAAGIRATL